MEVITNLKVYGMNESFKASKYPMSVDISSLNGERTKTIGNLAHSPAGCGEDNFLNGIIAQFDLTFSNKAWVEAERYHFFDFVSSQSTMHCILKFDVEKQYIKYVDERMIAIMKELIAKYHAETDSERKKELYLNILYSNPCGFRLTARMTTNYRQLKTIYKQRKNHRLPEWRSFCRQLENFPESDLITGES